MMAKLPAWQLENSTEGTKENLENTDEGNMWQGIGKGLGCVQECCKRLKDVM